MIAPETAGFRLNHTMIRVRDPDASLPFYTDVLGMTLLRRLDMAEAKFSLFFLGYLRNGERVPEDPQAVRGFMAAREGLVELTHNWGTESDAGFAGYANGNDEPRGFGHLAVSVPDVEAACARFASLGVRFIKRPDEGRMKGIAFVADPDGYWIEVVPGPAAPQAAG